MKRFRFSLYPVAVMRAHRELKAREALAGALAAQRQAEDKLLAARGRIEVLETAMRAGRRGTFRAADAAAAAQVYRREWAGEAEAQKQTAVARTATEKRREACVEANRELRLIQKLEAHARARYAEDVRRAEQSELDEIAVQRAARRNRNTLS